MKFQPNSLIIACATLLPFSTLAAETPASLITPHAAEAADPQAAARHLAAADALRRAGHIKEAIREVESAAEVQREAGISAAGSYWLVAELRNVLNDPYRTARALDAAAREASRHCDPDMQARALFESAVQYAKIHQFDLAQERLARVDALVAASRVSDETQATFERRNHGRLIG